MSRASAEAKPRGGAIAEIKPARPRLQTNEIFSISKRSLLIDLNGVAWWVDPKKRTFTRHDFNDK